MRTVIIIILLSLMQTACSSGTPGAAEEQRTTEQTAARTADTTQTEVITERVLCRADTTQSYALYIPATARKGTALPCIYFFDAHGRGALPLRAYHTLADKYGIILIGSNNSKNGTPPVETNAIVTALLADTKERLNIDPKRVYTCGFSGGAVIAGEVAIASDNIAGVIGCAAGMPAGWQTGRRKFAYCGIAGRHDFNYADMVHNDVLLEGRKYAHWLISYNGKHSWPGAEVFESAVLWLQVYATLQHLQPDDTAITAAYTRDVRRRISEAKAGNDLPAACNLIASMARMEQDTMKLSALKREMAEIATTAACKQAERKNEQLYMQEAQLKQYAAQQYTQHDATWWKKQLQEWRTKMRSAATGNERDMYQRMMNFTGFLSYMSANRALITGDLKNAADYLKVFAEADPENADVDYLTAVYHARKGDAVPALDALKQAAGKGYADREQMAKEQALAPLRGDARYRDIETLVGENAATAIR